MDREKIFCSKAIGISLFIMGLVVLGCGEEKKDASHHQFIQEIQSRPFKSIKKIPVLEPINLPQLSPQLKRDPFYNASNALLTSDSLLTPMQTGGVMSQFNLDTLQMVGSIQVESKFWALIKTPEASIYPVEIGDTISAEQVRVLRIEENVLYLLEPNYDNNNLQQQVKVLQMSIGVD